MNHVVPSSSRGVLFPERVRQPILDAAAVLLVRRREVAARLAARPTPDAEVVAVGHSAINQWLHDHGPDWREMFSTRPSGTAEWLRVSVPNNRYFVELGAHMISVFDYDGLDQGGRLLLAEETVGDYRFGVCPIQVKVMDDRIALLQGPDIDGAGTLMKVSGGPCLAAARAYREAALAASIPASAIGQVGALTPRQREIMALLAADHDDTAIATALDISVRTVRTDVASVLDKLGVKSRFAAGNRFRIWEELTQQ